MIPLLAGLIAMTGSMVGSMALAGPEGTVRGESRDRVAILSVKDFNLPKLEGKVVLVGFWQAVQCEQCEAYITWLTEMQAAHGEKGLVVVAVNQDQKTSAATDLFHKIDPKIQIVADPTGKMGSRYQLEAVPSSYLYDRNLDMQAKFVGFVPEETEPVEAEIVKLLKKKYKD